MEIYLVRHGQTGGNEAKRHQSEESHLTPLGKRQAKRAAQKIKDLQPTQVFVSNRVRAIETAQAIAEATDLTPQVHAVFTELCRPDRLYGYHHKSLQSIWYIHLWYRGKVGKNGCSDEGESYDHFFKRVKEAQRFLESQPADSRIAVVSHSIFINFFVAHLHSDEPMGLIRALLIFTKVLRIRNGSVTRLRCEAASDNRFEWKLLAYSE
jgi:broad specificity phosphatase PhoE